MNEILDKILIHGWHVSGALSIPLFWYWLGRTMQLELITMEEHPTILRPLWMLWGVGWTFYFVIQGWPHA